MEECAYQFLVLKLGSEEITVLIDNLKKTLGNEYH